MRLLELIKRKLVERHFTAKQFHIMHELSKQDLVSIMQKLKQDGWEEDNIYGSVDIDRAHWQTKLRKGTSTLHFEMGNKDNSAVTGTLFGPRRIVLGIGSEFNLPVDALPKWT